MGDLGGGLVLGQSIGVVERVVWPVSITTSHHITHSIPDGKYRQTTVYPSQVLWVRLLLTDLSVFSHGGDSNSSNNSRLPSGTTVEKSVARDGPVARLRRSWPSVTS